jgi:hypothetical protein
MQPAAYLCRSRGKVLERPPYFILLVGLADFLRDFHVGNFGKLAKDRNKNSQGLWRIVRWVVKAEMGEVRKYFFCVV